MRDGESGSPARTLQLGMAGKRPGKLAEKGNNPDPNLGAMVAAVVAVV